MHIYCCLFEFEQHKRRKRDLITLHLCRQLQLADDIRTSYFFNVIVNLWLFSSPIQSQFIPSFWFLYLWKNSFILMYPPPSKDFIFYTYSNWHSVTLSHWILGSILICCMTNMNSLAYKLNVTQTWEFHVNLQTFFL